MNSQNIGDIHTFKKLQNPEDALREAKDPQELLINNNWKKVDRTMI